MKNLVYIFFALFLMTSCLEDKNPDPDGVFIRVENGSNVDFEDILVSSGSGNVEFGNLSARERSNYKEFESAYRYGFVSLIADGKELRIQPYDYVGETLLSDGYYTYKLNLDTSDPNNPNLTLELLQ
ncbi:hypothetical protein SYJ56_22765 [Algoriphagus sp. D3-2-R+10]|uniref:hypothetical protein n=1 Tax=Algoriphagus aurantiacus TaxID=3103948 RepID=UPI002B379B9D|nr:hypothetical protein [Algoriphagus sp. D3-2-R+10]MEB2778150.1 hypothetical protein [Algoriphagus sp. D3-2-R+10]